jgi:23S rRNA pseudouridine1911/1915/1917 synthase
MSSLGSFSFSVDHSEHDQRLDVVVASRLADCSRSFAARLVRNHSIRVNHSAVKPGHRLKVGDVVDGDIPPPEPVENAPENIPLDFLYEDEDLAVINKQAGMVVHPAPGNYTGTLVNALLFHCPDIGQINGDIRPGIVHRLDKDTSGAMVVAKNSIAHERLSRQFKDRSIKKEYQAIVHGRMTGNSGSISLRIGRHPTQRKKMSTLSRVGRSAETVWRVETQYEGFCLLRLDLKTGRTHQIRVHCSAIHHPIVGDLLYGGGRWSALSGSVADKVRHLLKGVKRQMLHARRLQFVHPATRKVIAFEAPVPEDMQRLMAGLATYSNAP